MPATTTLRGDSTVSITAVIQRTRQSYIDRGVSASFYAINDGLCDEFAEDVRALLPADAEVLSGEMFMTGMDGDPSESDVWDWPLLEKWGITPPGSLSREAVDKISFGGHEWLYYDGLHYDAECPDGVASFFDLPLYKRCLDA